MKTSKKRKARIIKKAVKLGKIPVLVGTPPGKEKRPEVRFFQPQEGGGRIEVLCPCGNKILIDCDFE